MLRANRKTGTGTIAQQPCEIEPPPLLTSRFGDEGTQLFGLTALKRTINDVQYRDCIHASYMQCIMNNVSTFERNIVMISVLTFSGREEYLRMN